MDVFFVISGFVVTPLILRIFADQTNGAARLSSLRYFYKRRFYRLAPALAVTLTISAVTIFLLGPSVDHQRFSRQGIATLLLTGNVGAYKYSGDYFSPAPNPLVHTWSLSVEEQIYIFLPLALIVSLHNRSRIFKITSIVLLLTTAISFVSFLFPTILQPLYSRAGIASASQFSFYSPIDRIWQFTLGGLGYLLINRHHNHKLKFSKSTDFVVAIAVFTVMFSPLNMSLKVGSIFASMIAVTALVFKSLDLLPEILKSKLEWFGDRSYSIYLVHMPLLYISKYSPVTQIGNSENRIVQSTIAVGASILLGALSYSKIENRYRNTGKSDFSYLKTVLFTLVVTLTIPLALFAGMDIGVKKHYWGLDRNISQPPYAGTLDPKCLRDSEMGPPCTYANVVSSNTVLLLGDSHAGHISQAVVDAAMNSNWHAVVWTHGGCPVQFRRSIKEQVTDNCLVINNQMRNWVLKNKPKAIIISQFVRSDSSQGDLRNALLTLQLIVPNILLIENNPIFPDGKDFMISRPPFMSIYQPRKSFRLSEMQINDRNASNNLANWARKNKILTISFNSIFCTKENCTRHLGSDWLYRDNNHFSVAGAELTIPQITAFLKMF